MGILSGLWESTKYPTSNKLPPRAETVQPSSLTLQSSANAKNVKASDYPMPQQYLDDPDKIPSYYVFQSNMVTDEDLKPGLSSTIWALLPFFWPTPVHTVSPVRAEQCVFKPICGLPTVKTAFVLAVSPIFGF
eukprot:GHVT01056001.1.p1 GENE.GHVT01056001.1~~GHVT01056001.1.p1  ORF type:complete len:133 (+),score=5.13 GHVT01056001.1:353-751(+)